MSKIILSAIKQRKITLFFACLAALYGAYSYYLLPKQENPDVAAPVAMITTVYVGASPTEIEQLVTKPIENAASEVVGYKQVESWSANSYSIVLLTLQNEADPEKSWTDLRQKLGDIKSKLPKNCEIPIINTRIIETPGIIIGLSGTNYSYEQLESFANNYKKSLSDIDGVSKVEINGKVEKEVVVKTDLEALNPTGISLEEIGQIVESNNIQFPSGNIKTKNGDIAVRIPGYYQSLNEIQQAIINTSTDRKTISKVGDFTQASFELHEGSKKLKQNGENAILLSVFFEPSENILIIGENVRKKLELVNAGFPNDLNVDEVIFQPQDVSKSVNNFMLNVIEGIILVIIVVFIGMGFRNALVVSTAIPLSILLTFIVMPIWDIKIHQISLAALIIALGMLVDNVIVISDAVQVRLDEGMDKIKAAYEGAKSTAIPILAATLTTVAAFSPLLSIPGASGDFLKSIPQIVIISLSASFLVAMLVSPAMTVIVFKPNVKTVDKESKQGILKRFFINMLTKAIQRKKLTLVIGFGLFLICLVSTDFLKSQFFPNADKNIMYINLRSEIENIEHTEIIAKQAEEILKQQPEVINYTTAIGDDLPRFYITASIEVQAPDFAQIMFRFNLEESERYDNKEELRNHIQKELNNQLTGATASVQLLASTDPKAGSVVLQVSGNNIDRNIEVANLLKSELEKIPGTIKVQSDAMLKKYTYNIDVNEAFAGRLGITGYDIQRQINLALQGDKVSIYRKDGKEYDIILKGQVKDITDIENFAIKSSLNGVKVPLKNLASVELEPEYSLIKRLNKEKTIQVYCDVTSNASPVTVENIMENEVIPTLNIHGTTVTFAGEREEINRDFGKVGNAGVFALFLIFIVLLVQFNSFSQPMVILLSVPLSLIGSILGLLLFSQPLSFTALLGIVSLIGIVVNNAILLIDFINQAKKEGMSTRDACLDSVSKRFRPIILSSVTTIMGLFPLALSGSELFAPMAVALMCGLIVSTMLTIIVVPVMYSLIEK